MKRSLFRHIVFIFFLLGFSQSFLTAQDHRPTSPSGVLLNSPEPICAAKDYLFKIDTSYYPDGSVIYVCDRQDSITVVFKDTKQIIFGDTSRIKSYPVIQGATDTSTTDQYFSVWPQNFNNKGVAEVEVEIEEKPSNKKSTIKLIVEKAGPKIKIDNPGSYGVGAYAFDDHQYNYPGKSIIPSKLIIANKSDNVKLDLKSRDANKILAKNKFHDYLTPDSLGYSSSGNILPISHNLPKLSMNDVPVQLCGNTILDVDIRPERQVSLAYFTLCHKSDDTPNYCIDKNGNGIPYEPADSMHIYGGYMPDCVTLITSAGHTCIKRGSDGILTFHKDINYWSQKTNNSSRASDRIISDPVLEITIVAPSIDTSQTIKYFCNCRPPKLALSCPTSSPNLSAQLSNINQIYQKAGLTFTINNLGNLELPWDVPANNITNYSLDTIDYRFLIEDVAKKFLKNNTQYKGVILATQFNATIDANGKTNQKQGDAKVGQKIVFIDSKNHNDRTFAHELGHGLFGFGHPDDTSSGYDKINPPVTSDDDNFMNSGPYNKSLTMPDIKDWRIRKYQWRSIHRNNIFR
jgi:hypothetical protein